MVGNSRNRNRNRNRNRTKSTLIEDKLIENKLRYCGHDEWQYIAEVLFKGRKNNELWCLKEGTAVSPSKNISHGHVCIIHNNTALVIARNVLLVEEVGLGLLTLVPCPEWQCRLALFSDLKSKLTYYKHLHLLTFTLIISNSVPNGRRRPKSRSFKLEI